MSQAIRLRFPTNDPIRLTVPLIDKKNADASRRLDALELLICNEPDPETRNIYVRRFHEIWEQMIGDPR